MKTRAAPSPPRAISDPCFERARAMRFANFRGADWCHVLVQFANSSDARTFAKRYPRPQSRRAANAAEVWVPSLYAKPPKGMEGWTWCSAIVRVNFLSTLYARAGRDGIATVQLGTPARLGGGWPAAVRPLNSRQALSEVASTGAVVTGVIDDGLAIAHENNDDPCDAFPSDQVVLDLTPIATGYQEAYGPGSATVHINLAGWSETIVYEF